MKNRIRVLICAIVLFVMMIPVSYASEILTDVDVSATWKIEDMKVYVKGEIKGYEDRYITVVMYEVTDEINNIAGITDENADLYIKEIVQGKTDANGRFDIAVPVSESLSSGKYKVTVSGNWTTKIYNGVEWKEIQNDGLLGTFFDYVSINEQKAFVDDIALAKEGDVLGILENVSPIIFDYDEKFGNYEKAGKMFIDIRDELYPDGFSIDKSVGKALSEIEKVYVTSYSLLVLNNSDSISEKTKAVENIAEVNEIIPEDVDGDKIVKNIASDKGNYKSYSDFEDNAKLYVGLEVLNNATISGITQVLEDYAEYFGLDLSEYEDANPTTVNKYLHNKNFSSAQEVEEALEKGIEEYKKRQKSSTNNRVSGGSGGGGGKATSSAVITQQQEETENVEPSKETEVSFTDLGEYAWATQYINKLSQKGVVSGKTATEFAPGDMVSRAEFAKMIAIAFGIENVGEVAFNDVAGDEWYAEYLSALNNAGIMLGDENGNANPDADITRQDMAVVLHRASVYCEIALDKVNSRAVFEDKEEISDYAVESVEELQQAGIINGNGSGSFMPMAFATRAEAAKMICCLADLTEM